MDNKLSVILHGGAIGDAEIVENVPRVPVLKQALDAAWKLLVEGAPGEKAVVAALRVLEASEYFDAGYGSYPNEEGKIFVDAAIMRGNGDFSSLLNVSGVTYPSEAVLDMLQAGDFKMKVWTKNHERQLKLAPKDVRLRYGAVDRDEELISPYAKMISLRYWDEQKKRTRTPIAYKMEQCLTGDTVGCVVKDKDGKICAGTSTGGMPHKPAGRIGDAPVVGSGTFADNEICGLSATGHGEMIMRTVLSGMVISNIRRDLRQNAKIYDQNPESLKRMLNEELAEFKRKAPDSGAGIIVIPAHGKPEFAYNSRGLTVAMRHGTASKIDAELASMEH